MKTTVLIAAALLAAAPAGVAGAQSYSRPSEPETCRDHNHRPGDSCVCHEDHDFYRPGPAPWTVVHHGGPGIRVRGRPVYVPSGKITIQGPPIYVEAPPIRIAPTQIYLNAPDVHVTPSEVTVEPPEVHFNGCDGKTTCEPAGSSYGRPN